MLTQFTSHLLIRKLILKVVYELMMHLKIICYIIRLFIQICTWCNESLHLSLSSMSRVKSEFQASTLC